MHKSKQNFNLHWYNTIFNLYVTNSATKNVQYESWTVSFICETMISNPWICTVFNSRDLEHPANISGQSDFPHEKNIFWAWLPRIRWKLTAIQCSIEEKASINEYQPSTNSGSSSFKKFFQRKYLISQKYSQVAHGLAC